MKKFLLFAAFALCFATILPLSGLNAQCTPDTTVTSPGFEPNPLPDGCVNQPYSEVVTFVFPNDTTVQTPFGPITVNFDSFVVKNVLNIPAGMTYACNISNCTYITNPPNITRGCVTVSGTPTMANSPNDSVRVIGEGWVTIFGQATPFEDTINVGLYIDPCTAVEPGIDEKVGLTVYPNPTENNSRVAFNLPASGDVRISLVDMYGKEVSNVFAGQLSAGSHEFDAIKGELASGIYYLKFDLNNGEYSGTRKLLKF